VGIRCADHATPSTRKRLALTLSTSGSRLVGIVRLRTTAMVFFFFFLLIPCVAQPFFILHVFLHRVGKMASKIFRKVFQYELDL
jgi:hypothetical protein